MQRSLYTLLLLLLTYFIAVAQPGWQTHSAKAFMLETEHYQDKMYICAAGGLLSINLITKEENYINRSNSNFNGTQTRELEILANGHMWLSAAYDEGIYYYDGSTFTEFTEFITNDSIISPRDLVANEEVLWFRTGSPITRSSSTGYQNNFGALWSYRDGIFTDHNEDFPEAVDGFTLDKNGNLWVVNNKSLSMYDGQSFSNTIPLPPIYEIPRTSVKEYYIDKEDNHWLSVYHKESSNYFIWTYQDETWKEYSTPQWVDNFYEDSEYDIIFMSREYFGSIDGNTIETVNLSTKFPEVIPYERLASKYYHEDIGYVIESENYIGENQIFHETTSGTIEAHIENSNFLVPYSQSIIQGCNGELYVAGYGVAQQYSDTGWVSHVLPTDDGCRVDNFTINPTTCQVWGYSDNCGFLWEMNSDFKVDIAPPSGVEAADFDSIGNLYVTSPGSIIKIDSVGASQSYNSNNSPVSFSPYQIYLASDQSLWVVIFQNGYSTIIINGIEFIEYAIPRLLQLKDGDWIEHPELLEYKDIFFESMIYEDNDNHMWFNTDLGLWEYDGDDWEEHLFDFRINDMVQDAEGDFWMATKDKGLAYWDGTETTFYNTSNSSIWSDRCYELELIEEEELWVRNAYGLTQIQLSAISSNDDVQRQKAFTLFPNPSSGEINIEHESALDRTYQVYDMSGREILSERHDGSTWSTYLQSGPYLVRVSTEDGSYVEKVIIAK